MDHRYGRHGSGAWLRWRSRHYLPPDQVPIPTSNTKVYVYELSPTERVIYIVTENAYFANDDNSVSFTRPPLEIAGKSISPEDTALINIAQNQAVNDAEDIEGLSEDGFIRIVSDRVHRRVRKIAREHVTLELESVEYDRRLDLFSHAYEHKLKEEIENHSKIHFIETEQDAQIQDIAKQDRLTYPTYASRRFHQRDIAVIRALTILGVHVESSDAFLEAIHKYADKYEEFFRYQDEEVEWPSKDFRTS